MARCDMRARDLGLVMGAGGPGGGNRTLMPLRAADFESAAYAIPPLRVGPSVGEATPRSGRAPRGRTTGCSRPEFPNGRPSAHAPPAPRVSRDVRDAAHEARGS